MPANHRTFVTSRARELKLLYLLVFLGILGSAWFVRDFVQLALLEMHLLIP